LQRINYGTPTSKDFQELQHRFELTEPPDAKIPNGHWESIVDSAILTDLSRALYGESDWTDSDLFTKASGKHAADVRQAAIYLDFIEDSVVNVLSSTLVYFAFQTAQSQHPDSPTESFREIFDLAINFIIFLATKLYEEGDQMTNVVFNEFLEHDPAYMHGMGLIFHPDTPQAKLFLMKTYRFGAGCDLSRPYFGGTELHLYIGPRRIFGKEHPHVLRNDVLKSLGLAALTADNQSLSGPVDDMTASYIHTGPFRLRMSDDVQDHLTFRIDGTVLIYNVKMLDYLMLFRNCIAEYVTLTKHANSRGLGIQEFGVELWKTHLLIFGRDEDSMRIATNLGVNMSLLRAFRYHIFPDNVPLQLEDFPFFQHRLNLIQTKMDDWVPQNITQLWVRGYHDPVNYYTFVTALFFGILGVVGVAAGIIQTVGTFTNG
jgi:hypothetical protein